MYNIVTFEEMCARVEPSKPLAFDTESTGLYEKTRLAQFYQAGWDKVLLVERPDEVQLQLFLDNCWVVMHNAHYDITAMQQNCCNRWIPKKFDDTFLLARLHYPREEAFNLEAVMTYVLGYDPYKKAGFDKKEMQKSNWSGLLTKDQLMYASIDVRYLLDVYDRVKAQDETMSYQIDMLTLKYCLDFQWNGMPVNMQKVMLRRIENAKKLTANPCPINPNSYIQVRRWLDTTESDDLGLARLAAEGDERAALIRLHRKVLKQNNFLTKYSKPRVIGKFKPSARSGRLTSDDDNLQQIPRSLKEVFEAPPGKVFIYADYAQLELRTIAVITKCIEMIRLFKDGQDLHDFVCKFLFREDFTKEERQITKTCNFNFLYGGGILVFLGILLKQVGIKLGEAKAGELRRKWRNLFKEISAWQERGIAAHRAGKTWKTPFGREYLGKLMTDQLNIQNQGFGAEVAKLALHYILKGGLPKDVLLCDFIHDSFIIEAPDDPAIYEPIAKHVGDSMQEAWFEACKMAPVHDLPMPVKVFVGKNWGDIEKGEGIIHKYELKGLELAPEPV